MEVNKLGEALILLCNSVIITTTDVPSLQSVLGNSFMGQSF